MAEASQTQAPSAYDPSDSHYVALVDIPEDGHFPVLLRCGSGADVTLSEIKGGFVMMPGDHADLGVAGSPALVECEKHGQFIGLVRVLQKSAQREDGAPPESYYMMLMPLTGVQHVHSLAVAFDNQFEPDGAWAPEADTSP